MSNITVGFFIPINGGAEQTEERSAELETLQQAWTGIIDHSHQAQLMYDQALVLKREGKVDQARELLLAILQLNVDPFKDASEDFRETHQETWNTMRQLWYGVHKAIASCWLVGTEQSRSTDKQAIDHLLKALRMDASDHPVWQTLAKAIWRLGDRETTTYTLWLALALLAAQYDQEGVPFSLDHLSPSARQCFRALLHALQGSYPEESPMELLTVFAHHYPRLLPHVTTSFPHPLISTSSSLSPSARTDPWRRIIRGVLRQGEGSTIAEPIPHYPISMISRPFLDPLIVQPIRSSWPEIGRALGRLVESQKDE